MRRRKAYPFLSVLALAVAGWLWALAGTAAAQVSRPCTAAMNGVDVNQISTPGTALEVPYDGTIKVQVESQAPITGQTVALEFAGIRWTVWSGTSSGTSWGHTTDVAKYAKYGVGVYKVVGESTGAPACTGTAYVKVTGKSPLTTVAGIAGAVVGVIGLGLLFASVLAAVKPSGGVGGIGAGVLAGILLGASFLVLTQQFAIVYPTAMVVGGTLAVGIALGILIPVGLHAATAGGGGAAAGSVQPPR
jgi:hypothetical protein